MNGKEKVLIVDDEELILMTLRALFEDLGYRVVGAANGREGLEVFAREKPSIVFTDLRMPEMDGLALIAALHERSPETPVIVISGVGTLKDAIEAVRLGAWDYVTKPVQEMEELEITTRRALERARLLADNRAYRQRLEELLTERTVQLRESEERFQSAFEYAAIGMGLVAPDGKWLKVNRSLCGIVGYEEHELLCRTFQDITHPDDLEADLDYVRRMLAGEISTYQMEKRYFHKQGRVIWVLLSVSLVRDRDGKPMYFISQVEDISKRKLAESELLKVNRTLRTLGGCNEALIRARDESKLLDDICRLIVESGGYASAWVGYAEQDVNKTVIPVSQCGFLPEYVRSLSITWDDTEHGRGPTGKAIRTGEPCIARNVLTDPDYLPWREMALKHGYSSAIALPLLDNGKAFGALNIYSSEPDPFHEEEVRLLKDLAGNLAHGIMALRAERELAGLYETLREEVDVSTSLLKMVEALNATLDEKTMIKNISGIASRYLKFDRVIVLLYDEEIKSFVFAGGSGLTPAEEGVWLSQSYREGYFPALDRLRNGEMVIAEDALQDDLLPKNLVDAFQTGSMVSIPIAFRGKVVGGILGDYRRGKSIEVKDVSLLKGLADGLGVALQNSRLYRESIERLMDLSGKVETIKAMAQLDREILSNIDMAAILRTATALINRIIPCDRVGIILTEGDSFRIVSEWGVGQFLGRTYPTSGSHCETFEKNRISIYRNDLALDDCPYHREQGDVGIKSFILVPLVAKSGVIGFLDIGSIQQGRLAPGHLSTAENIASQLAVALENARLYDELQQLLVGTITSLASAIDAKSPWTNGHSERVTQYALAIGKEMGLKAGELERLRLAGLLHDIGKIGTYDVLLDKPGKLTDEEFDLVKRHPKKGAEILSPIKQLKDVLPGIRHHHEKYDGKGYPDGLKGEEIPLHARILCVADSFDSMTADRPYRPSPGREYAISEFRRCLGTQFDPAVVEAFLRVIDRNEV
jgi:PAS domain S-box-containing protein/putative nucleotidyltransferase with HDIG domain